MLNEVFGVPFPEVAAVVGGSPAAVRQLGVRARAHVAAGAPRVDVVEAGGWVRRVDLVLARSAAVSGFLAAVD
jgi:RNA polymerase sigma-70 factor (ECF subfamily)